MAALAIIDGGHVRVGFEDNVYLSKGVPAKSNGELVEKVVRMAKSSDARSLHRTKLAAFWDSKIRSPKNINTATQQNTIMKKDINTAHTG